MSTAATFTKEKPEGRNESRSLKLSVVEVLRWTSNAHHARNVAPCFLDHEHFAFTANVLSQCRTVQTSAVSCPC